MIKKIITVFLTVLYLSVTVGFAVHTCHCEHSQHLAIFAENHCTCGTEQQACTNHATHDAVENCCTPSSSSCPQNDEEAGCCQVEFKAAEIDAENPVRTLVKYFSFSQAWIAGEFLLSYGVHPPTIASFLVADSPPQLNQGVSFIYHYCQLRL